MIEKFITYSPLIVVVTVFYLQQKIFVTPADLEKKHREIIDAVQTRFATSQSVDDLKEQVSGIKDKVDKIYDYIIKISDWKENYEK